MAAQLLYFADPMCSWCWGFAPVIAAVRERFGAALPVHLVLGGLRPGTTEPMTERSKATTREHWEHVHEAAGQPFDFAFFERDGFVYDTEPACRAAVVARRLSPDDAIPFLDRLHRAFYSENQDVTGTDTLCALAAEFGLDGDAFRAAFETADARQETEADFIVGRRIGIQGYPALLAGGEGRKLSVITLGFQPWQRIEPLISSWLEHDPAAAPAGAG